MTDILTMAREAGFYTHQLEEGEGVLDELQRFADLIRADYRAKLIGASVEPSLRAGEELGDFTMTVDHYSATSLTARVAQAQAEERERYRRYLLDESPTPDCYKYMTHGHSSRWQITRKEYAPPGAIALYTEEQVAAIRARSVKEQHHDQ